MQLGGVPHGYRNLFLVHHLAVTTAQLDLVVSGPQCELLGVLESGRVASVDVKVVAKL
jgi:hypothetical protein